MLRKRRELSVNCTMPLSVRCVLKFRDVKM